MKYRERRWFVLPSGERVKPFNGEADPRVNNVSWSHGLTHFRNEDGIVGFCGVAWFEKNAQLR